jgi:hypothetical protein
MDKRHTRRLIEDKGAIDPTREEKPALKVRAFEEFGQDIHDSDDQIKTVYVLTKPDQNVEIG